MKKNFQKFTDIRQVLIGILALCFFPAVAQTDTIVLTNSDAIVGEIKDMNRGVLTIETAYSDSDFKIDWEKIVTIKSTQHFTLILQDRSLLTNASIVTVDSGRFRVLAEEGTSEVTSDQVVYVRGLDDSFWSKMSASMDVGYSITKANNLRQFNASARVGYKSKRWVLASNYQQVNSRQDEVDPIRRVDGSVNADYSFSNGMFLSARLSFLSNTEQNLDLRTTGMIGFGYYLIRTNQLYWNVVLGPALNVENVGTVEGPTVVGSNDRRSLESVLGTELSLYDIGDLNLFTNVFWYPSLTESGRNRVDYNFNLKYDLPLDFYIKGGLTLNYDSEPAAGASETDYVILTGFGWEL